MNWEVLVWFGIMLAFLAVEAACPLHLVSIWFSTGALVAMIAAVLHASIAVQIVLFVAVSAVLLICLWPFTRKFLKPKLEKTNVDAVIGTRGLVTSPIDNVSAAGKVKLDAMEWTARSTSGEPIPQGTRVSVDRIEGVKAFVSPVKTPATP